MGGVRRGDGRRRVHRVLTRTLRVTATAIRCGADLDGAALTVDQIRFVGLIIDELTANGVVPPTRLVESPYTDHAPTGPDLIFPTDRLAVVVDILHDVTAHARPEGVA